MKKKHIPKWISPEQRMKRYEDYGINGIHGDITKVKFTEFKIVVPTEEARQEIMAALEYLHNLKEVDMDFITVNQLVHQYEHNDNSDKYSNVIVNSDAYHELQRFTCKHMETYNDSGVKYCKACHKGLEVTSYRD